MTNLIRLLGASALLAHLVSCSAPSTKADSPARPTNPLTYSKLDETADVVARQFKAMWLKPRRHDDDVLPERMSGQEAMALLKADEADYPASWDGLLSQPGSLALRLAYPDHGDLPTEFVFVPLPDGYEPLERMGPDGGYLMLGLANMNPFASLDREVPVANANGVQLEVVDVAAVRAKISAKETFVVFVSSDGCSGAGKLGKHFTALVATYRLEDKVVDLAQSASEPEPYKELVQELMEGQLAWPSLLFIRDGKVADRQRGGSDYWLGLHFLARNGFAEFDTKWGRHLAKAHPDRSRWIRYLSHIKYLHSANLENADLAGIVLRNGSLAGSYARGADLRNADLREVDLFNTDLTGANLAGANLTGAVWGATTCPDGTLSDDHGDTCDGHISLQ